jgi:hypothetical protein
MQCLVVLIHSGIRVQLLIFSSLFFLSRYLNGVEPVTTCQSISQKDTITYVSTIPFLWAFPQKRPLLAVDKRGS